MTTATASKTALYRVERRRARRQVRHGSTLLTAQMGFLAVVLCSMALLRPLLSPADAPAAVHAWDSRMEALDGAHGSVWEGPDDFRRSLVESSRPPSPPPPDKCFATCEKEAFTTSDDTGFPEMWVTTKSAGENAYVACFQFFVILLTFLGLAIICDDYFMAALEAIVEAFGISEDVAGATWMAAGGSAPELSTSIMGVFFAQSDVGIGTIIGSAVFNVLFVIACCAFVAPNLRLSWWPLARDSVYYCFGITFLVAFMVDERVHIWEAIILLLLYGGYITVMKYNESLEEWVNGRITLTKQARAPWQKKILALFDMHLFNLFLYFLIIANTGVVFAELTLPSDTDCHNESEKEQARIYGVMNYVFSSIFALEMITKWAAIGFFGYWRQPLNCFDGILVGLIFIEIGFSFMTEVVAETKAAENLTATDGADVGFVGAGRSLRVLRFFRIIRTLRVFRLYRAFHKHYADATTQVLPGDWHQTANGQLAKDSSGRSSSVIEQKVDAPPRASIAGESEEDEEEEEEEEGGPANPFDIPDSIGGKIFWLLGFPISLAMFLSIPDCRRPAFKKLWPLTFICSIAWIAVLAYFMVWMTTDFGMRVGAPDSIMGLTLLAAGTSIPDALSSVAVAKRGHGDMAVSSSIGSNIFDILFGLPIPWLIATMSYGIQYGSFTCGAGGSSGACEVGKESYVTIGSGNLIFMILLLFLMVALVITTVHLCGWRLLIKLGYMMMLFYFIFLAIALLLETGMLFGSC